MSLFNLENDPGVIRETGTLSPVTEAGAPVSHRQPTPLKGKSPHGQRKAPDDYGLGRGGPTIHAHCLCSRLIRVEMCFVLPPPGAQIGPGDPV